MAVKYADEYMRLFASMKIRPERLPEIDIAVNTIEKGKARYQALQAKTGVPWFFIGMLHYMEAACNFSRHLHNGDSLNARTVYKPAGRPLANPGGGSTPPSKNNPYTFEESAVDAIHLTGLDKVTDWSVPEMLYRMERYNGFGYRNKNVNIPSPYLWSFSNHYTKGKFIELTPGKGTFVPTVVSKQAGTAVILYRLLEKNNLLAKLINAAGNAAAGGAAVLLLVATVFF